MSTSTTIMTAYDENTGFIKPIAVDDNTLAPVTATDVRAKYGYSAGGGDFAVGHRKLFPTTAETSKSQFKTAKRAEGHVTWSGGLTTLAMALAGVKLDDEVYAEIVTEPTEAAVLVSAVATEGVVTFTLDSANTSNDAVLYYAVYSSPDVLLPTLASVTRTTDTKLRVVLSEIVDTATITKSNAGGFTVHETGAPSTTYAVSAIAPGANSGQVDLTLANVSASALVGLTVKYTKGGNGTIADVAGNLMATDATGVVVAAWDAVPTMLSAERIANTTLRVTLSEDANTSTTTKANDGGFVVYEKGTPATTYAVSAIAPNGSNHNQVDLTVADVVASAAAGLTVTYAKGGNGTVADTTGNLMNTNAVGVDIAAW